MSLTVAILTAERREAERRYDAPDPAFGAAPEALLQGFAMLPDVKVHVLSCSRKPLVAPAKLADNIWYHNLHVPRIGWTRTLYQGCVRAVRKKLRDIRPDIVHGQGTEHDNALSAVLSGFPNVVTIHGNMAELARLFGREHKLFYGLAARLEDFALKRTAGVFCNSAYTEQLVRPRTRRTWRVPNPIRAPFFAPTIASAKDEAPIILNIGFVSPRKRQTELLQVAAHLREQGLKFELQFIGEAPASSYAATFLDQLKPLEAAGCARYVGLKSIDELVSALDAAAGVIHFPSEEAFGLVVAEALARNRKFFGSRVGGIADIACNVPGAELFESDDWNGLTSTVETWIRAGCEQPVRAAEIMRERYHPSIIAQRHIEIYREVLSKR